MNKLQTLLFSVIISLAVAGIVFAFTNPSGNPPIGGGTIGVGSNAPANSLYIKSDGNVGIGTPGPGAKLEVTGQVKITGGAPEAGKVLTSDANGLATWESAAGGVPTGAVMFFNLATCPTGWTALAGAQGRYLVGLPSAGTLAGVAGTALSNLENRAVGLHSHTATQTAHSHLVAQSGGSGTTRTAWVLLDMALSYLIPTNTQTPTITVANAGTITGTNAPNIQLLVCQKN